MAAVKFISIYSDTWLPGGGKLATVGMEITAVHHIALTVTDIERSRKFYHEILSIAEIPRPPFNFPGAWFQLGGAQQLHLIVHDCATLRDKPIDPRDVHFAVRVPGYYAAVEFLRGKGYREDADRNDPYCMILEPHPTAGFPQIYICDPDRHVIEINSASLG
jgi:catechol 2,3-dioxygenase-like lactoylglutathione lyase family enzyme